MAEKSANQDELPDVKELAARMAEIGERSNRIVRQFLERQDDEIFQVPDPRVVTDAFTQFAGHLLANPEELVEAQLAYWKDMGQLWEGYMRRMLGEEVEPMVKPAADDRRFKDDAWTEEFVFDYIKQAYLVTASWIHGTVAKAEGLDPNLRQKVSFFTRQYVDAMAPSNFAATNPVVLRRAAETRGESLYEGLRHLLMDLERGRGELKISMTKEDAFVVGENIAASEGTVVFENELMQLVQYSPLTETVQRRPLLIIPPWINKFYILDLKPRNSFIRFAVQQGLTVFVISWVNPSKELAHKTFEDYLKDGPLTAMQAIERQTGETELNVIGYCLGGTLTACLLAHEAAKGKDRIKSATFFTTMLDFSEPGDLAVFIDDQQLDILEQHMAKKGYLESRHMQQVFNLMRANDLIWSFVVSNYLMGREPMAFDLLYWNADSTAMPHMMHSFYLRNMYQKNRLVEPGGITLDGVPIDLQTVRVPAYFLSTKEDHIAPWKATYKGSRLLGGPVRFVLGGSGHIAGVINPADSGKYGYWTGTAKTVDPERWLEKAERQEGSWWPDWRRWLERFGGGTVPARDPQAGPLPVIEPAPGRFVRARSAE
jgi:polyhydroxyalkanoate synthase subunit PhaC